jgi:hypothetical protein
VSGVQGTMTPHGDSLQKQPMQTSATAAPPAPERLGGLPTRTLEQIQAVWRQFPQIRWLKHYGSRALGQQLCPALALTRP